MKNAISRRRSLRLAAGAVATVLLSQRPGAALAADPGPTLGRRAVDADWVDGTHQVRASAAVVQEALRRLPRWGTVFHDVRAVGPVRETGRRQEADVTFGVLGDHGHHLTLDDRGTAFDVYIAVTGAEVRGTFVIAPLRASTLTSVTFSLLARTYGVAGIFVSQSSLRAKQETLVESYLRDLAKLSP